MKFFDKIYRFVNSWTGTIIIVLSVIFFVAQAFVIPSGSMLNTMLIGDNLFVKKYAYGIPTPTIPWIEFKILPDFNNNGHLFEGERPKRGDIVIFRYPLDPKIHFVKRNVAIGGDEVIYTKDGLWVHFKEENPYSQNPTKTLQYNGKTFIYDPYLQKHPGVHYDKSGVDSFVLLQNTQGIAMEPIFLESDELGFYTKIAEDEFFMMGDNRDNSNDSRKDIGMVPLDNIEGKAIFRYYPFNEMGVVK